MDTQKKKTFQISETYTTYFKGFNNIHLEKQSIKTSIEFFAMIFLGIQLLLKNDAWDQPCKILQSLAITGTKIILLGDFYWFR